MKHGHRFLIGALVAVALTVALALLAAGWQGALAAPGIIYVDADATGGNDGSSWDDAYTDLQPALAAAAAGDEIWVAAGTYKPTSGTDRSASFQMVNGVAIYGGFDPGAGATKFRDRDWVTYVAILSGDIGSAGDNSDNSYHVFYHPAGTDLDSSAILNGFTITSGNADGVYPDNRGGGMFNYGSSPVLINCTFADTWAYEGGGMWNGYSSSPTLSNCAFTGNEAHYGGGGICNLYDCSPTLSNCTFDGNLAVYGGGIYNRSSSPELTNCTFESNTASGRESSHGGGGMFNFSGSSPTLADCIFLNNSSSSQGGGMFNYLDSSPRLTNVTFANNSAETGGGMYNGGMFDGPLSPVLANCAFSGNSAETGGGMFNSYSSSVLTNCTFSNNSAGSGGAMYNRYSPPVLTNSILWADTPDEIFCFDVDSAPVITYSDVQGGYAGTGNIDADPLFVDPGNGDFHLGAGSPCIDAGDNLGPDLPLYDFEGDDRILDGDGNGSAIVDMGIDEVIVLTISVEIDITPNTPSNMIRLGSGADVPVAVLTTAEFDAASVDPGTVLFAGAGQQGWILVDVDGDGDDDLLLYFDPRDLDLDANDKQATLTGETFDGTPIEGTDRVKVKE